MSTLGGLVGIVSKEASNEVVKAALEILRRQKYLGEDGTGLAGITVSGELYIERYPVEFDKFVKMAKKIEDVSVRTIIGEVRYATHGRPSIENTPPLSDCERKIYVVMEGVIRDYDKLREKILEGHHVFTSRNDTEILAHLLEEEFLKTKELAKATAKMLKRIDGFFSAIIMHTDHPDELIVISKGSKIFIGSDEGSHYVASEIEALHNFIDKFISLKNAIAIVSPSGIAPYDIDGKGISIKEKKVPEKITYRIPGGYNYFMEREIYESPDALRRALIVHQDQYLELITRMIVRAEKMYLIGAGTSYHAALLGGYLIRELAGISANVIDSTEFPYYALKDVTPGTVIIALSQSGKSTDIIRAVSKAKMYGASIIGITNRLGTPLMFASNLYLPIGVGLEHAVPATKSFLGQLLALYKIAFKAAEMLGTRPKEEISILWKEMEVLPDLIEETIHMTSDRVSKIAQAIYKRQSVFVSSRGLNYPIALEGALKIKEVSYIHAEGIEAGMLRHGPKAVIDKGFPVIVIMPYEKDAREDAYNLLHEVQSLGAEPIIITDVKDKVADKVTKFVIRVPKADDLFTPFVNVIPLQLLALNLGILRNNPIDSPRGLSKYVVL